MNELCIYIALLLCNAEHPKWFSIMMGLSSTSCKQTVGVNCQKALFLFHLSTEHFPRKIVVCSGTLWQRSVVPFVCLFFNNGVFFGLCPWSPAWFSVRRIVLVEIMTPDCSRLSFRSLDVRRGVVSIIHTNLRRVLSSVFLFPLRPGRFLTVLGKLLNNIVHCWKVFGDGLIPFGGLVFAVNSNSDVLRQLLCLHHYDKGTRSNMWLFKNTEVIIEWLIYVTWALTIYYRWIKMYFHTDLYSKWC